MDIVELLPDAANLYLLSRRLLKEDQSIHLALSVTLHSDSCTRKYQNFGLHQDKAHNLQPIQRAKPTTCITMNLSSLFFWTSKTAEDNAWHPVPGQNPTKYVGNLPPLIKRQDLEAACVDIAPFVAGASALAYVRQLNDFGFTASANVFQNPRTLMAMHKSVLVVTPVVLLCQALGVEYRRFIPRWSQERERGRDEEMVRQQVGFGMLAGVASWTLRIYALRWGRAYWAPIDVVMGGALADVMHREYVRAHGF